MNKNWDSTISVERPTVPKSCSLASLTRGSLFSLNKGIAEAWRSFVTVLERYAQFFLYLLPENFPQYWTFAAFKVILRSLQVFPCITNRLFLQTASFFEVSQWIVQMKTNSKDRDFFKQPVFNWLAVKYRKKNVVTDRVQSFPIVALTVRSIWKRTLETRNWDELEK